MSVPLSETQNDRSPDTTSLYAWLSRDQDGIEGIIVAPVGSAGMLPLVVADQVRARKLQPVAAFSAHQRGFSAHLVRFQRAETILEAAP